MNQSRVKMLKYHVEIQHMDHEDNGYGYYCNLEEPYNAIDISQKKPYYTIQNIPDFYPAEYYFDEEEEIRVQEQHHYDMIANKIKTKAYNIFSEVSLACICAATTWYLLKYYK